MYRSLAELRQDKSPLLSELWGTGQSEQERETENKDVTGIHVARLRFWKYFDRNYINPFQFFDI